MTDTHKLITDNLITDNIDIWTSAVKKKSATGRGSSKKIELTGINKLRELILEFAFCGKLIPNVNEYCDHETNLQKMFDEKAKFHERKGVRLQKFKPISEEFHLNELPNNWKSIYFDQAITYITDFQANGSFSTLKQNVTYFDNKNYALLVRLTDLRHGLTDSTSFKYTDKKGYEFLSKSSIDGGELVVANVGAGVGTTLEIPEINMPATLAPNMFMVVLSELISKRYFLFFSQSPMYKRYIEQVNTGTGQPKINKTEYKNCKLPLPPLAEQHRIVAKVDELMALCDQLEQQTEQSLIAHQTLVEELLKALTDSKDADDFKASWQRIAEHFDILFTTEQSIERLKQTTLQLAVMGKLVPQNPSDEPASVLLEKIAEEKAQLIADKKIKKQKPLPTITDEEKPFVLPIGWEIARFYRLFYDLKYGTSKKSDYLTKGSPVLRIPNVVKGYVDSGDLKYSELSAKELSDLKLNSGDLLLIRSNGSLSIVGSCAVVDSEHVGFAYAGYLVRVRLNSDLYNSNFISLVLRSRLVRKQIENPIRSTSGVKNINSTEISRLIIPIVPLAEQHRIVAKVDELMALCEQLKVRLSDAQTTQRHLADAVVQNALN
jgi:type I restriction enzyme S subunit